MRGGVNALLIDKRTFSFSQYSIKYDIGSGNDFIS